MVTNLEGEVEDLIGGKEKGWKDGSFSEAKFSHPQGLALNGQTLYLADTDNHLIRAIDLDARRVSTIAGTGERNLARWRKRDTLNKPLNFPTDIVYREGILYVTMKGAHQIWSLDLVHNRMAIYAGTIKRSLIDAIRQRSTFDEPSGITFDGDYFYITDSGHDAIRRLEKKRVGRVKTIIRRSLQYPLGITFASPYLYAADTYNNSIKKIDLLKGQISLLAGDAREGKVDGPFIAARFNEPSDIAAYDNKLFVVDTNNQALRILDLKSETVSILEIKDKKRADVNAVNLKNFFGERVTLPAHSASVKNLNFTLNLPGSYKLVAEAKSTLELFTSQTPRGSLDLQTGRQSLPIDQKISDAILYAKMSLYFCREGEHGLCLIQNTLFEIPMNEDLAPADLDLEYSVPENLN